MYANLLNIIQVNFGFNFLHQVPSFYYKPDHYEKSEASEIVCSSRF